MEQVEFDKEFSELVQEYATRKGEEGAPPQVLTAAQIPDDLKAAMGFDIFPEDIQNEILALSQKIVDYVLDLASEQGEEGPPNVQQQRFINCIADMPSRQIHQDAWRNARTVWSTAKGPLQPLRVPGTLAALSIPVELSSKSPTEISPLER